MSLCYSVALPPPRPLRRRAPLLPGLVVITLVSKLRALSPLRMCCRCVWCVSPLARQVVAGPRCRRCQITASLCLYVCVKRAVVAAAVVRCSTCSACECSVLTGPRRGRLCARSAAFIPLFDASSSSCA